MAKATKAKMGSGVKRDRIGRIISCITGVGLLDAAEGIDDDVFLMRSVLGNERAADMAAETAELMRDAAALVMQFGLDVADGKVELTERRQ